VAFRPAVVIVVAFLFTFGSFGYFTATFLSQFFAPALAVPLVLRFAVSTTLPRDTESV